MQKFTMCTPAKRLWCYFGQHWLLFKLSSRFKSTCNKVRLKSLVILNSTAGRRRQAKSTRLDFGCPSRLGSTYWGRLPGLLIPGARDIVFPTPIRRQTTGVVDIWGENVGGWDIGKWSNQTSLLIRQKEPKAWPSDIAWLKIYAKSAPLSRWGSSHRPILYTVCYSVP